MKTFKQGYQKNLVLFAISTYDLLGIKEGKPGFRIIDLLKRSKDVVYQALLLIETLGGLKNASYVKYIPMIKPIFEIMKSE